MVDAPAEAARPRRSRYADAERWLIALLAELPPARAARVVAAVTGSRATTSTRARSRSKAGRKVEKARRLEIEHGGRAWL